MGAGKKIVVGMSGGVDSSMALVLLKRQGWEPVGVSLRLPHWEGASNALKENACCTAEAVRIAGEVCAKMGAEHHVLDVRAHFERDVMGYFVGELAEGRTPNPCATCNRAFKFDELFAFAQKNGIDYVSTGHYARTHVDAETGLAKLLRATDKEKDQTYGLSFLPQEWLQKIIFPLGGMMKEEVYGLAAREGFGIFTKRKQSQDFCFVSGNALPKYVEEKLGRKAGEIVDEAGKVLGRHEGLHFYTVGQRKGLRLPEKCYVKALDFARNRLVVTRERENLRSMRVLVKKFNFVSGRAPEGPVAGSARVRYRQEECEAELQGDGNGGAVVMFKQAVEAVAPGQVCVFYSGEECVGGGRIQRAE